ncbi:MAG: rhomboid family intramembrane serine protease [Myxococcota bacterium]|nr:rhomboid family intramembrane serine protease [Myxococcota bacterium]
MYGRGRQTVSFGPPQTPDVIKTLILVNVGIFIVQLLVGGVMIQLFAVTPAMVWQGGYLWQPFTYMWLHSPGSLLHILFNMFALWMFGSPVAAFWGERRFLRYYLLCGIGAGFVIAAWPGLLLLFGTAQQSYYVPTLGASGAVFGVLLAYALTWPDRTIMLLFPPIPIKAIWFIPIILAIELLTGPSNVSSVGHLGGVLAGFILLRRMGVAPRGFGLKQLRHRWRRWRMRRNLRAVQMEERRRDDERRFFH